MEACIGILCRRILTFFAVGSFASNLALANRRWSLSWLLAFLFLLAISSRFILFLIIEGSKREGGIVGQGK